MCQLVLVLPHSTHSTLNKGTLWFFSVSPNRPGDGLATRIPPYSLVKAPATLHKLLTVLGVTSQNFCPKLGKYVVMSLTGGIPLLNGIAHCMVPPHDKVSPTIVTVSHCKPLDTFADSRVTNLAMSLHACMWDVI